MLGHGAQVLALSLPQVFDLEYVRHEPNRIVAVALEVNHPLGRRARLDNVPEVLRQFP